VQPISSSSIFWLEWPPEDIPDEAALAQLATAAETLAGGSAATPVATLPIEEVVRLICGRLGIHNISEVVKMLESQRLQRQAEAEEQANTEAERSIKIAQSKPKTPVAAKG